MGSKRINIFWQTNHVDNLRQKQWTAANVDEAPEFGRWQGEAFHYHERNNILLSKSFSLLSPKVAPARCLCPPLHQKRRPVVIIDGLTDHQMLVGDEWLLPREEYLRSSGRARHTHKPISTLGLYFRGASESKASDFCQRKGSIRIKALSSSLLLTSSSSIMRLPIQNGLKRGKNRQKEGERS